MRLPEEIRIKYLRDTGKAPKFIDDVSDQLQSNFEDYMDERFKQNPDDEKKEELSNVLNDFFETHFLNGFILVDEEFAQWLLDNSQIKLQI